MNSEKYPLTKHTIKNPSFFDIDEISNDYITNHNKKYYLFLIKSNFKLIFNNDCSKPFYIETDFYHNTMFINLKRYLLYPIESFIEKGHEFSHIDDMNISTINDKMYMTYDYYIQHPMPAIEMKLNIILAKNPNPINSLNRSHIHPLIRKYSHIAKVEN